MVANAMPVELIGQIWGEYSLRKSMSKDPGECPRFIFYLDIISLSMEKFQLLRFLYLSI